MGVGIPKNVKKMCDLVVLGEGKNRLCTELVTVSNSYQIKEEANQPKGKIWTSDQNKQTN